MTLNNFFKKLLPKEDKFFLLLEEQVGIVVLAAHTLSDLVLANPDFNWVSNKLQDIEHQGDDVVNRLEKALSETFITPIDREDIHQLSVHIDDVIDYCNTAAQTCKLYGVDNVSIPMNKLIAILYSCSQELLLALPALRRNDFKTLVMSKAVVKALEKQADAIYRDEISRLFHEVEHVKTLLKDKAVLDALENAIDRCEDITKLFTNLAIKNG